MGIFSAIGKLFGGGNSGGAIDSRIAIRPRNSEADTNRKVASKTLSV